MASIQIKSKHSLRKMEQAGILLADVLQGVAGCIKPGVSTLEIDAWIENELRARQLVSQSKGYMGYKHVSCISVNDVVVHGIPSKDVIIKDGDLVKVDVCAAWSGYCADMARCFYVGNVSDDIKKMVASAQRALDKGIEMARPGNRISDISAAIQREIDKDGYGIVRDFAGHGIGKNMHEDPEVLNYGKPGTGPVLRPGMALAIEPMITMGSYKVKVLQDGWTVTTVDKSIAAHVEDTIIITEQGAQIITRPAQLVG
jgi:methionyl aminopeptidase